MRAYLALRILVAVVLLAVLGAAAGAVIYKMYPDQMAKYGGMAFNFYRSFDAPKGTLATEANPDHPGAAIQAASSSGTPAPEDADWPSFNRTVTSDRYSPLAQITTANAGQMKVLCTYDTGVFTVFESGLIMVDGALIGTTEFDIFSLDPATCAENWRTHEDIPPSILGVNRGAAYLDGMLFRGTQDGRVLAYDFKTGKRLWETTIADPSIGETVPAAPIAWDGMVYVGQAGGDYKGVKGRMYGLDAKTGKIVWEFYLVPFAGGRRRPRPAREIAADRRDLEHRTRHSDQRRRHLDVDHTRPRDRRALRPRRESGAGLRRRAARGRRRARPRTSIPGRSSSSTPRPATTASTTTSRPTTGTTGTCRTRRSWCRTQGGKDLVVVTPKDGHVYGIDRATGEHLYRVPATTIENVEAPFVVGKPVRFCPGSVGGAEWNSPAYDPATNLILVGEVDWCYAVTLEDTKKLETAPMGTPWSGMSALNPFNDFGNPLEGDSDWHGWVYAVDADTGEWAWRAHLNYPVLSGMTPTAGGVVFFGDVDGNFYALNAATGEKLWGQHIGGGIGGGVITYTAGGAQKVAVAAGFTSPMWPTKITTAKVMVLGIDE